MTEQTAITNHHVNGQASPDEIQLDDVTAQFLADVDRECQDKQRQAMAEAAVPYVNQQQAALQLFIRRENLQGKWKLQADNKTLRREE
jgi:predicted FMN-binding regulatory protein PaiB